MIRGIHHVAMNTANFDRMVTFYTEGLGFEPIGPELHWRDNAEMDKGMGVDGTSGRSLILAAGNCFLEMFEFHSPEGRDGPLLPQDRGYTHFCIDVTDIDDEIARLATHGMTFASKEPFVAGETKAVYARDPDGNIIEIMETGSGVPFEMSRLKAVA